MRCSPPDCIPHPRPEEEGGYVNQNGCANNSRQLLVDDRREEIWCEMTEPPVSRPGIEVHHRLLYNIVLTNEKLSARGSETGCRDTEVIIA